MSSGRSINVRELGVALLDTVVGHFATAGVALPERRYLAPGEPRAVAWDCEQLTVTLGGIGWGQAIDISMPTPAPGTQAGVASMRHAVYEVTLVRCTPTRKDGKFPGVAEVEAAGQASMVDAGLLSQALVEYAARVRPGLPPEGKIQTGAVTPIGSTGGFHGLETQAIITATRLV